MWSYLTQPKRLDWSNIKCVHMCLILPVLTIDTPPEPRPFN